MSPQLKVLLYNYVQPNEPGTAGGGVTVYMRNLVDTLRDRGHRVWTLSCGDRYDLCRRKPRLAKRSEYEYVIYNSPVVAPAIFSFYHPEIFLQSKLLNPIAEELSAELDELDIVHFHNIEGLTYEFFDVVRSRLPRTRMIYSAHNYNIGCSQVTLWQHGVKACDDYSDGFACVECCTIADSRSRKIFMNRLKTPMKEAAAVSPRLAKRVLALDRFAKNGSEQYVVRAAFRKPLESDEQAGKTVWSRDVANKARMYREFRAAGARLINEIFDQTIAVSACTAAILESFGARRERIRVCYIGTKHAERFRATPKKVATSGSLHIAFFGYMRRDKGFYYFLSNLQHLPDEVRSILDVTVAARFTDSGAVTLMNKVASSFRNFTCYDGYSHENLDKILKPVNLGIVPPLWEDNLPQVAIEFVTHGIPILTSNRGGAAEIASNPHFVFDVNSPYALAEKLVDLTSGRLDLSEFWSNAPNIRSNEQHVQELMNIYTGALPD